MQKSAPSRRTRAPKDEKAAKAVVIEFGNPHLPRAYDVVEPKLLRLNGIKVPHAVRERAVEMVTLGKGLRLGDFLFQVEVPWDNGRVFVVRFDDGDRKYYTSTPKKFTRNDWHPSVAKMNGLRRDLHKRAPEEWHSFIDYLLDGGTVPFPIVFKENFDLEDTERQIMVALYCKYPDLQEQLTEDGKRDVENLISIYQKRAEKAYRRSREA